jgi:hypothetical protein
MCYLSICLCIHEQYLQNFRRTFCKLRSYQPCTSQFPTVVSTNMADAHICYMEATLAPLNLRSRNDVIYGNRSTWDYAE